MLLHRFSFSVSHVAPKYDSLWSDSLWSQSQQTPMLTSTTFTQKINVFTACLKTVPLDSFLLHNSNRYFYNLLLWIFLRTKLGLCCFDWKLDGEEGECSWSCLPGFTSVNWNNSCGPIILITVQLIVLTHCLCSSFGVPTYCTCCYIYGRGNLCKLFCCNFVYKYSDLYSNLSLVERVLLGPLRTVVKKISANIFKRIEI